MKHIKKNVKKALLLSILMFSILSCKKQPVSAVSLKISFDFYINDKSGNNWLSNIDVDSIRIYHIFEDSCKVLYEKNDFKGWNINNEGAVRVLLVSDFGHTHNDSIYSWCGDTTRLWTTLIQWNTEDIDTVVAKFRYGHANNGASSSTYDKVYYNGKLIVSSWEDNREKMSQGI
jgi:hypothetical protein